MTILERLRAATGPDRNLDAMVHHFALDGVGTGNYADTPRYTASIDAALDLVGRMLPGWACGVDTGPKTHIGFADPHDFQDRIFGARYTAEAATPALAILTALFAALEAKEKKDA